MSRTTKRPLLRSALGLALGLALLSPNLSAQGGSEVDPTAKPKPQVTKPDVQDGVPAPAAPAKQDPVERLKRRLARLANELRFFREVRDNGGLAARLKDRLTERAPDPRSIRVEIAGPVESTPQPATGARVMNEEERSEYNPQVVFVVEGVEAREDEFNELKAYLRSARPEGTSEEALGREAVKQLLVRKLSKARAGARAVEAFQKINELKSKLDGGADFAETAKSGSQCPSAPQGGDLGAFPRGAMDTTFEAAAFTLGKGERSGVVETPFGYHLILVEDKLEESKQVRARHILRTFHDDPMVISRITNDVARGNCRVVFRDDEFLALCPF